MNSAEAITKKCEEIKTMLLAKNASYGNSALDPISVFSKASAEERLKVRIDDKISRISKGHEFVGDDTYLDLAGYLVLMLIAREQR